MSLPQIHVRLESVEPYRLAYRPDTHGARWRGGFHGITDICADADRAGLPEHCEFVFEGEAHEA